MLASLSSEIKDGNDSDQGESQKFLLREGGDMMLFWWEGGGEDCNSAHKKNAVVGNPSRNVDQMFGAWVMFQLDFFVQSSKSDNKSLVHIPNLSGSELAPSFSSAV